MTEPSPPSPRTYSVICSRCQREKWPYRSTPPPTPYVCQLCLTKRTKIQRKTEEQQAAFDQVQDLARPLKLRVIPDPEGFPFIPGRLGRIEWHDPTGRQLAVYSDRPSIFHKLRDLPGVQRHQTGDSEVRALFHPDTLEAVAGLIQARKTRVPSEEQRQRFAKATHRPSRRR